MPVNGVKSRTHYARGSGFLSAGDYLRGASESDNEMHKTYVFYVRVHMARAKDVKEKSKSRLPSKRKVFIRRPSYFPVASRDETSSELVQSGFQLEAKSHAEGGREKERLPSRLKSPAPFLIHVYRRCSLSPASFQPIAVT